MKRTLIALLTICTLALSTAWAVAKPAQKNLPSVVLTLVDDSNPANNITINSDGSYIFNTSATKNSSLTGQGSLFTNGTVVKLVDTDPLFRVDAKGDTAAGTGSAALVFTSGKTFTISDTNN
jgi:hypothetical protein